MTVILDTAALAAALGVKPSRIRKLAHKGVITPLPERRRIGKTGRPSMLFDAEQVQRQLAERRNLTKDRSGE